jgi:colanic acid/amylovoran biosynthesis glycosyltransferase
MKVAYILSRFPKITETFILNEILALAKHDVEISIYSLLRPRSTHVHPEGASIWKKAIERISRDSGTILMHPEAEPLMKKTCYAPFLSWRIIKAQFYFLLKKPGAYLSTLGTIIRANWGSANFLLGSLAIFPKTVHFAQLMRAEGVNHIHAHFANHPAAAAFIIHKLTSIPYSFTAHGADLQVDQHMLMEKVLEAAIVITISNYNKEFIINRSDEKFREKIQVIHCGIDTGIFKPSQAELFEEDSEEPFKFLCIGTMYEVKGHTYLIDACRILKERGINFDCHLVGDGPDRQVLQQQVTESGLENYIHFYGVLTHQEIVRHLQSVDALVLPSIPTSNGRREGIPVVLMEAMACAKPVVASGISGIPELVEDHISGLLVPPREPQAIADALIRLNGDEQLCNRLGRSGRLKVECEFDIFKNSTQLLQAFSESGRS